MQEAGTRQMLKSGSGFWRFNFWNGPLEMGTRSLVSHGAAQWLRCQEMFLAGKSQQFHRWSGINVHEIQFIHQTDASCETRQLEWFPVVLSGRTDEHCWPFSLAEGDRIKNLWQGNRCGFWSRWCLLWKRRLILVLLSDIDSLSPCKMRNKKCQ